MEDGARSIKQTYDGGYIVAGLSYSIDGDISFNNGTADYWVVKLDTSGNIQWQKCIGGPGIDQAYSIQQTYDGSYIVAGYVSVNGGDVTGNHSYGYSDCWIVKLSPVPLAIEQQKVISGATIPSDGEFTINIPNNTKYIQISNSLGQVIEKRPVKNQTETNFEIRENGIYFVQVITDKETITKKIIIEN